MTRIKSDICKRGTRARIESRNFSCLAQEVRTPFYSVSYEFSNKKPWTCLLTESGDSGIDKAVFSSEYTHSQPSDGSPSQLLPLLTPQSQEQSYEPCPESIPASIGSQPDPPLSIEDPQTETDWLTAHTPAWLSPLHVASKRGNEKIVKLLVQHNSDCSERDGDGRTPLTHAVIGGFKDVVRILLQHGARVCDSDVQGCSALHLAVAHRRGAILQLLLENCHDLSEEVNAYNIQGQTPLHMAVDICFEEGVHILLQYGANVCLRGPDMTEGLRNRCLEHT